MPKSNNNSTKPEDTKPPTLGEVFCTLAFDEAEQQRISSLATKDGPVKQLLSVYAPKTEPYREFEKKERIDGFRPGTESFKQKLSLRLLEHLAHAKSPRHNYCWEIYRLGAIKYVTTELSALNKLLGEIECPADKNNAEALYTAICTNAFDYDVKPEDITLLYEIWWTDRLPDLNQLLKLCTEVNEQRARTRMMNRITTQLHDVAAALESLSKDATHNKESHAHAEQEIEQNKSAIQKFQTELKQTAARMNESVASLKQDSEKRFEQMEDGFSSLQSELAKLDHTVASKVSLKAFESQIRTISEENKILLDTLQETFSTMIESTNTSLTEKLDELEQRFAEFCKELLNKSDATVKTVSGKSTYRSPLAYSINAAPVQPKIAKEVDFVNSWSNLLSRGRRLMLAPEQLFMYHALFHSNTVVIADVALVETWIDGLGWRALTKEIVASPLWAREEDWSEGALHLFGDLGNSKNPRVLIVHNYDAGIIDCYLLPTLMLWSLSGAAAGLPAKIFLVTTSDGIPPSHGLLEYAAFIDASYQRDVPRTKFVGSTPIMAPIRGDIPVGVDPKIALQWIQSSPQTSYDLNAIQRPFDLQFPDKMVANFQRSMSYASRFFDEPSAVGIAMHHHILPWVKSKHPAKYDAVLALVSELPGITY